MTAADLIRLLEDDGWRRVGTRGSHRQYTHEHKPGVVTLRRLPREEITPGAAHGVLRQAGLEP
ncbi:MAG TPA: type II toxin-antitoxin system HicA family toxin [Longimicrobium sp.]|nr:type II toxin-antitoxin system HicA family toxin [Longimicrobium sp.]